MRLYKLLLCSIYLLLPSIGFAEPHEPFMTITENKKPSRQPIDSSLVKLKDGSTIEYHSHFSDNNEIPIKSLTFNRFSFEATHHYSCFKASNLFNGSVFKKMNQGASYLLLYRDKLNKQTTACTFMQNNQPFHMNVYDDELYQKPYKQINKEIPHHVHVCAVLLEVTYQDDTVEKVAYARKIKLLD